MNNLVISNWSFDLTAEVKVSTAGQTVLINN